MSRRTLSARRVGPYKGDRGFRIKPGQVRKSLLLEEKVASGVSRKPDDG